MAADRSCELCGNDLSGGDGRMVAQVRLCAACEAGDLGDRLVPRGIRLEVLSKAYHPADGRSGGLSQVVEGAVPYDVGGRGEFSVEDGFRKFTKWFIKELQVGDQEFDDRIYIGTDDKAALAPVLAHEGLRAAILNAVDDVGTSVVLDGSRVHYGGIRISDKRLPQALRNLALLLHNMLLYARSRNLTPDSTRAHFPNLSTTVADLEKSTRDSRFWPKGIFLERATLDSLEDVVRVHRVASEAGRPLRILRLVHCHLAAGYLGPLSRMTELQEIELDDVSTVCELPSLAGLTQLEELTIQRCGLSDLGPLADLPSLHTLKVRHTDVSDLTPLASLPELKKLDIRDTAVTDLTPLLDCEGLEILWIAGLPLPSEQRVALKQRHRNLEFDPY